MPRRRQMNIVASTEAFESYGKGLRVTTLKRTGNTGGSGLRILGRCARACVGYRRSNSEKQTQIVGLGGREPNREEETQTRLDQKCQNTEYASSFSRLLAKGDRVSTFLINDRECLNVF